MMKKAFTLIELLTVMAITAVMLTLIVLPIFQSFNLTRTAQAFVDAQDKGRLLTERIAREVGNAISVRDAASTIVQLPAINPTTRLPLNNGTFDENELPYTKLDLIPPAQGAPSGIKDANGRPVFIDPNTGKIDPTLTRPKGDINLPVRSGATLVRWFVGLRDPLDSKGYNEPYTGLLMARNGNRDNLFVLRRAEVQPFVYRPRKDKAANDTTTLAWRPNLDYFHSDDQVSGAPSTQDFDTRIIDLDDPKFFLADGQYLPEGQTARVADSDKNRRVANWAGVFTPGPLTVSGPGTVTIQTEISRYDMIRPILTGSPAQLDKTVPVTARVVPLVQFRPTRVAAAPAQGSAAARPGEAVEGLDRIGPDTFQTQQGLWTDAFVRYYPNGYKPNSNGTMELASVNAYGAVTISNGATSSTGIDGVAPPPNNYALFDAQAYEQYLSRGQAYPFTQAVKSADLTDANVPGYPGQAWTPQSTLRQLFTPFRILTSTGKIVTSFPIDQVGTAGQALSNTSYPNVPIVAVTRSESPTQAASADTNLATAPLSPVSGAYDPNRAYNRLWTAYPELQGSLQRYIDLRFVPQNDGTMSPLCPIYNGGATGFAFTANGSTVNRVRIVPGSDQVYGPDQLSSLAQPPSIRYTRVTGNPGPNQYRLVYADLPEPVSATGVVDYSSLGYSTGVYGSFDPANYDANNVVSAAIQPRFKAGYLQFDSDPNFALPVGNITVSYRFQFNGPGDTFSVDLDTREVMQILLTIKNYPQSSLPNAQTITLKSTATLRNALR